MKVYRKVKMKVSGYEVGDQIKIKLSGYGKFTATCHKIESGKALFIFDNCVTKHQMNEANITEGGFEGSSLCNWMNKVLVNTFPPKLRKKLCFNDGLLLWIPSKEEVFGNDEGNGQLELMKDRKNRISSLPDDEYSYWWLRSVASPAYFACVSSSGYAASYNASDSSGVRPAFEISNL